MSSIRLLILFCIVSLCLWITSAATSSKVSPASLSSVASGMNIPKVDLARVRTVWLSLHNTERKNTSLTPFIYSSALEWTATTWAKYLANLGKTTGLHKRIGSNSTYSYPVMTQRFLDQWIVFAQKDGTLFSESIGRNFYSCKKTDCTDDLIKSIKKSRTFFMSEKWKKYRPHYNAIVGKFSTMWLWVVIVGNRYYLVSHYTQDLK